MPVNSFVNYFEVSYDKMSLQIKSAFFNFAKLDQDDKIAAGSEADYRALFGERSTDDEVKDWFFSP